MRPAAATSRRAPGFTLIELLVVIAVVMLLAGLLLVGLARSVGNARVGVAQRAVDTLVAGVEQFRAEFGFLPPLVHDGAVMAAGSMTPDGLPSVNSQPNWPVIRHTVAGMSVDQLAVWSESDETGPFGMGGNSPSSYFNFMRRRSGTGSDAVRTPSGAVFEIATAWEDRRYSKFSLPYYLAGIGPASVDGIDGPGMSRPLFNGQFEGVLLRAARVGTTRERFEPVVDTGRASLRLVTGYQHAGDYTEHNAVMPPNADLPDSHAAFVDPWGRAYRYYRWERGRVDRGRLVVDTSLDLNLPPVLINPELYAEVRNNDGGTAAREIDLTAPSRAGTDASVALRAARFAVVSAGPDGLFGTEAIEYIAERMGAAVPTSDAEIIALRKAAWEDNIVGVGN